MSPLKQKIQISLLFLILVIDILFFTVIRNDFSSVYMYIVASQFQESLFIIAGFIVAVMCSSMLLYIIYKGVKKSLQE